MQFAFGAAVGMDDIGGILEQDLDEGLSCVARGAKDGVCSHLFLFERGR